MSERENQDLRRGPLADIHDIRSLTFTGPILLPESAAEQDGPPKKQTRRRSA